MLMYLCRVSFLTTLDLYKTYFRGCHRENTRRTYAKGDRCLILFERCYCVFCALGFCNQVLLDFHCWWSEELCSQQSFLSWWFSLVLGSAQLVSHVLGFVYQKGWRSYIEEFRDSEAIEGFCCNFIFGHCRV